jgi:hypothetical protein
LLWCIHAFAPLRRVQAPGRNEKTNAAHDQAATFSLEILFAGLISRHIEPFGSATVRLQTPVGGPFAPLRYWGVTEAGEWSLPWAARCAAPSESSAAGSAIGGALFLFSVDRFSAVTFLVVIAETPGMRLFASLTKFGSHLILLRHARSSRRSGSSEANI